MRSQTGDDVGMPCGGGEAWEVKHACVSEVHMLPIREAGNYGGLSAGRTLVMGAAVVRRWLVVLKSRMAYVLIEAMSRSMEPSRAAAATAYLWVRVWQC